MPDFVMAAADPAVPFTLLSSMGPLAGRTGTLNELDTPEEPDDALLSALFAEYEVVTSKPWDGFPGLDPDVPRPSFAVDDDFYYPNAIESLVSTIEFGALAARNTANLLSGSP